MTQPEVWLRGPLPDYIDELQPVAHSLMQVREEVENVASLTAVQLWTRPGGAASIGFHLKHLAGSLDRLMTYALGKPLTVSQYEFLAAEEHQQSETADTLVRHAQAAIDRALDQVRRTPLCTLDESRDVGRHRLPSTVLGLLFHAAEHAQRHSAQIITTAKVVRAIG
jgi:uncharacterized damage-inducible protein DinB